LIRLLIAAPSAVMRAGLEALAISAGNIELVGSHADLAALDALRPDVALAAVPLGEIQPPAQHGASALVLLTNETDPEWTPAALRLGVRALLARDASAAQILAAVEAAGNGLAVIDPHTLEELLPAAAPIQTSGGASTLTSRELEVLRMIAEGAANKTIAWNLKISEHTVKFHVASILSKLNASSRTEAVSIGLRKGLVLL
jgi:two-component system, NarL family, response regulator YdfI